MKKIYVFLFISFFLIPIKISADCTNTTCVAKNWQINGGDTIDKIVQRLDKQDKTIWGTYHGDDIILLARQLSGTNVYCIKNNAANPGNSAYKVGTACNAVAQINNDPVINEKLRAAIGYILHYSEKYPDAYFDKNDNFSELKNSYMRTQYLIHKVLAAKNGGIDEYDSAAMTDTEKKIYDGAIREYNNYKSQSVEIGEITTNLNGNNYEITADITTQRLTTNGTYSVKSGNTELASGTIASDATELKIPIDRSKLASVNEVELTVLYNKEGFYLARFKSCGDNIQPITESKIDRIDYPEISASKTVTVQKKHTLDINVVIDGELKYYFSDDVYATSNFSVGGKKIWEGSFKDHSADYVEGSSYSITNILAKDGYEYKGYNVDDGGRVGVDSTDNTIKGQINEFTAINLTFVTTESYTIKKINSRNEKVMGEVIFNVYSDELCTQNLNKQIKVSNGSGSTNLPLGTLYIQEQSAPQSYHVDTTCKPITVTKDGTNEITITNKTKCEYDFEQDNSIYNRLNLYKIHGYRNLLNFDIQDSWDACSPYEPNYDSQESCLYTDKVNIDTENKFTSSDLSDYNDNITSNGSISYCLTDFELESLIDINSPVKAGRLVYGFNDNNDAITGTITKTCYIHEDDISNYGIDPSSVLSNYVGMKKVDTNNNNYYYVDINDVTQIPFSWHILENNDYFLIAKIDFLLSQYRMVGNTYYRYIYNSSDYVEFTNINNNYKYRIHKPHIGTKFAKYSKNDYSLFYNLSKKKYYFIPNSTLNENYVLKNGIYFHKNYSNAQNLNSILTELFSTDNLYTKNIGNISLEGKVVSSSNEISDLTPTISSPVKKGEFYVVTGTLGVAYKLNPVSVYKLSGKECSGTNGGCTQIGYGILSKFKDAKNSTKGAFDFSISEGFDTVFKSENDFRTDIKCEYDVDPEIIKYNNNDNGNLDLEFRTIDTKNPFNRTPKSNWNDGSNKNDSDNSIINNYIFNATNSYGIKNGVGNQTPKYKIILTPDVVEDIRENNKQTKYDDYYEPCSAGDQCKSKSEFLNDLYEEGIIE